MAEERSAEAHRPRGRPSDQVLSRLALEAAQAEFLEGGYQKLSMESVASRAGVSKVTLYRRWANKVNMMADVLRSMGQAPVPLPPGPLRSRLQSLVRGALLGDEAQRHGRLVLRTIGEIAGNPDLVRLYQTHVLAPRIDQVRALVEEARGRGELPVAPPLPVAAASIGGPLLLIQLSLLAGVEGNPDAEFADQLVESMLHSLGVYGVD